MSLIVKYLPWILLVASIAVFFKIASCQSGQNEALETHNRQVLGQLDDSERLLQNANTKLGVSKSELLTQEELNDRLKKEKQEVDKEFDAFRKKHNLILKAKDLTIAKLQQQIQGGNSETNTDQCEGISENCVISYSWSDNLSRFSLKDPNIFKQDNETFTSSQLFKIYGEVYQQQNGSLKTKRIVLREIYKDGDQYKEIKDGKAEIIDAKFEYSNEPAPIESKTWRDLFILRPIIVGSLNVIPDNGTVNLGTGIQFFELSGFGVNTYVSFDFTDAKKIEHRLGLAYSPKIRDKQLNFAVGLSAGSPYYKMFKQFSVSTDIIFYLY